MSKSTDAAKLRAAAAVLDELAVTRADVTRAMPDRLRRIAAKIERKRP